MSIIFSDTITINISSGKGGNGAVSFRREKFVPRGGPDGGDGGDGGDVIIQASKNERTLGHLRTQKLLSAEDGHNGTKVNRHGKNGKDLVLVVPLGTVIKDSYGMVLANIVQATDTLTLLKGGRGGKGNAFFKSSVRQAPQFSQDGAENTILEITVALELIADFGFIGAPNVGKSTLLKMLTNAHPKIANYPFTTLVPNVGTLKNFEREIILADIPGLIEKASEGHGLGMQFLRHIKKTTGLVFVLDLYKDDIDMDTLDIENTESDNTAPHHTSNIFLSATITHIIQQYEMLLKELASYDISLLQKPQIVVMSKSDMSLLSDDVAVLSKMQTLMHKHIEKVLEAYHLEHNTAIPIIAVSSFTGTGIDILKDALFHCIKKSGIA